jgi:hypothetical protein
MVLNCSESISRAAEGSQEPGKCALIVVSMQQKQVLDSRSRHSEKIAVCTNYKICDLRAECLKVRCSCTALKASVQEGKVHKNQRSVLLQV